jgi:hypothetical protein
MKQITGFGYVVAIATFLLASTSGTAQGHAPATAYALRVEGLTSEDRDALKLQLKNQSDLQLIYACVPAGVLVFESGPGTPPETSRLRANALVRSRTAATRITELPEGLAGAEAACAQTRNR